MVGTSHLYRFKDIVVVPKAKDLIDIVLSKTQRKTPTQVHPQFDIKRIRSFYMRKVKFAQQTFHDKFTEMIQQFPQLDEIHPFYADLCNVLYDRDHYKLALGQVSSMRNALDGMAKDYVRLLKFADSPYKCKMLKRAALGRMCTSVKKLEKALLYLEEVRRHLSRLPRIDPFVDTLLLSGFPNVGKSTFMNKISKANVEVGEWAFTTKAPHVGHFDHQYKRWQVVDTPGILDRPLSARNTIELTAITALAHLTATVVFFLDISGTSGYTLEDQIALFKSLKPLLVNKPTLVLLNKIDVRPVAELSVEEQRLIQSMADDRDPKLTFFLAVSSELGTNVDQAKLRACSMLLTKNASGGGAEEQDNFFLPKLQISVPDSTRQPFEPDLSLGGEHLLERTREQSSGGPGVYVADDRKNWVLDNVEWKYDNIPEIFNGKVIARFVDPQIDQKLEKLEAEETALFKAWDPTLKAVTPEWANLQRALGVLSEERELVRMKSLMKKKLNGPRHVRRTMDLSKLQKHMASNGVSSQVPAPLLKKAERSAKAWSPVGVSRVKTILAKRLELSQWISDSCDSSLTSNVMGIEGGPKDLAKQKLKLRLSSFGLAKKRGTVGRVARGFLMPTDRNAKALGGKADLMQRNDKAIMLVNRRFLRPGKGQPKDQICESDRFIGAKKPKHLFSGKRSMGKTDRR